MKRLLYATTNDLKFQIAANAARDFGIELARRQLEVDEIQSEDAEKVVRDKAAKAFAIVKQPVVTSDDSWNFLGLRGWPGVYMKSMNSWLGTEDFLRLMAGVPNKKVILTQMVTYQDADIQKVFVRQTNGRLLDKPRGNSGSPNQQIIVMDGDNGLSVAEVYEQNKLKKRKVSQVWYDLFEWYKDKS